MVTNPVFSFLITTRNRWSDLQFTLQQLLPLLHREDVECLVVDDGSTDGTTAFVKAQFPQVQIFTNPEAQGYMYNRNFLLHTAKAPYLISLDDDAHFVLPQPLEIIQHHFEKYSRCGLIACRVFWGKTLPATLQTDALPHNGFGFVGCGHVWRKTAWESIPDYPEHYGFYGEEEFASMALLQKRWEMHYVPDLLVHHRVEVRQRKNDADYAYRQRKAFANSIRNYMTFYPYFRLPYTLAYCTVMQFLNKLKARDYVAFWVTFRAIFSILGTLGVLFQSRYRLTKMQYIRMKKLPLNPIFWKPNP